MKSAIGGSSDPSLISRNLTNNETSESSKPARAWNPPPVPPSASPGRPGRDGSQTQSLSKTHFWQTIERHAAPVSLSRSALTYGSHWRGYSRWAPLLLHLRAPGRNFPHGQILYEHARTTNAPRQAPVNRSVSVSNAPVCPVGVTCAQPAVGASQSREPTRNLHGNLLEIARSRRARLCL